MKLIQRLFMPSVRWRYLYLSIPTQVIGRSTVSLTRNTLYDIVNYCSVKFSIKISSYEMNSSSVHTHCSVGVVNSIVHAYNSEVGGIKKSPLYLILRIGVVYTVQLPDSRMKVSQRYHIFASLIMI
jgi:hypothetical protein